MEQPKNIDKKDSSVEIMVHPKAEQIINKIMKFLQLFMCETLVKRIVSLIMIAFEVPNARITELTGLCDRSIRTLKKKIDDGDIDSLFIVGGGGRKRKLHDVEGAVVEEIEKNNYHSRQQIADMIDEKFGIKVSLPAIGRLLKKTESGI
jgi:transposase